MDVVKTRRTTPRRKKALAKAENNLEIDPTDKDYLAAHAKAKADLDAIAPQNEAVNQWSKEQGRTSGTACADQDSPQIAQGRRVHR